MQLKSFSNLALTGVGFVGVPELAKARVTAVEYISPGGAMIRPLDSVLGYTAAMSRPRRDCAPVFDMHMVGAQFVAGRVELKSLGSKNPFIGMRFCPSCYEKEKVVLPRGEHAGTCPKCKQHFDYLYTAFPPFFQYYGGMADADKIECSRDSATSRVADRLKLAFFKTDPVREFARPTLYAEVRMFVPGSQGAKDLLRIASLRTAEEVVHWANGAVFPQSVATAAGKCERVQRGERGVQVVIRGASNVHKYTFPASWHACVAAGDSVKLWQEIAVPFKRNSVYPDDPSRKPHSAKDIHTDIDPVWRARLLREVGLRGVELGSNGLPNDRRSANTGAKLYPARWFANCPEMVSKFWVSYIGVPQGAFVVEENPADHVVLPVIR